MSKKIMTVCGPIRPEDLGLKSRTYSLQLGFHQRPICPLHPAGCPCGKKQIKRGHGITVDRRQFSNRQNWKK